MNKPRKQTQPAAASAPGTDSQVDRLPSTEMPFAVMVGFDSLQGLPAARTLARHGVPVIGVASDPGHCQSKTNVCREIIYAPTAEVELIPHLVALGKRLPQKAILFPCEDTNVLLVSRHRDELANYYKIMLPEPDVVEMLMDKVSFYSYAMEHDLPIPKTFFIENEVELADAAAKLVYPCVLKPRDSAARKWESETIFKAFKIHDAQELIATHQHYQQWTDGFIVQEWIEGRDSDLYSCNCYFNADSQPLATFIARKIRQWPPETGVSCLGEEVRNDEVLEQTLRLFRNVRYRGLGYMEMKRDNRNGKHYIVEPNIGRPTGRSSIAEAGGVELMYTAYCDAAGLPLPENRTQTYQGVKWIHLRKDTQSAIQYWRRGELTLIDWWRSLRGRKSYAVLSLRDPWPFIYDWLAAASSLFSPPKTTETDDEESRIGVRRCQSSIGQSGSRTVIGYLFHSAQKSSNRFWIESAMACRAWLFAGNQHTCPCCGWRLRAFTHGGTSLSIRPNGYCPRCNSKARHRRDWLYLQQHTNLFRDPIRLLHVSPKYAIARRLSKLPNIDFVGVDLDGRPLAPHKVDITQIPFESESFDAIICIHVMEHVENDRQALEELYRVLKPGGWALLSVPIDLSQPTYEDPEIVSPADRKTHFGEEQHVRMYGNDFGDRLKAAGFQVRLDLAVDLPAATKQKYGLLDDENVFHCTKN